MMRPPFLSRRQNKANQKSVGQSAKRRSRKFHRRKLRRSTESNLAFHEPLEPRVMLASTGELIANYQTDFSTEQGTEFGWRYLWNAPVGWVAGGASGNQATGPISDPSHFREMEFATRYHTADGDQSGTNSVPDRFVRLGPLGGHPGGPALGANLHDRYAIASYKVDQTGRYEINESTVSLGNSKDGIEIRVFVERESPQLVKSVAANSETHFDTTVGYLDVGDTIYVAFGAEDNHASDFFRMNFSIYRDSTSIIVADFVDDFTTTRTPNPGWGYHWNAPEGWTTSGSAGNRTTNPVGDPASYSPLVKSKSFWTADGDQIANNSPASWLRMRASGSHPGVGYPNSSSFQDRFVIASYTVKNSGLYAITDSSLALSPGGDGVEVYVHVDDGPRLSDAPLIAAPGSILDFDMTLGYLEAGDTIYVAYGANNHFNSDFFQTDFSIERIVPREEPLRDLNIAHVISVGAPSASGNDLAQINQAFNAARNWQSANANAPVEIRFAAGQTYRIDSGENIRSSNRLQLLDPGNGTTNWLINGNGATFLMADPRLGLLRMRGAKNVIVKDLTVDYETLPFTQGTITNIGSDSNGKFIMFSKHQGLGNENFPDPDAPHFVHANTRNGLTVRADGSGRLTEDALWTYGVLNVVRVGGQFKVYLHSTQGLKTNDGFILQARNNSSLFSIIGDSHQVSYINVDIYTAPISAFTSNMASGLNVIDSSVITKPGSTRWHTINGDVVHAQSNRIGPWVENSHFTGTGDDVMNFYTRPFIVLSPPTNGNRSFHVGGVYGRTGSQTGFASPFQFRPGDHLTFFDSGKGEVLKKVRVVSFDNQSDIVTVDEAVPGISVGADGEFRDGITIYNSDVASGFLVQGTTQTHSRRYGNLVMSNNGQIVDNVYEGLMDQAIVAHNETSWPLGLFANDLLIQGNKMSNNGFSHRYNTEDIFAGVLGVTMDRYDDQLVNKNQYEYKNLEIRNNVINHWRKAAISVRNALNANIVGNVIMGGLTDSNESGRAIEVHYSKNVTVENNVVADLRSHEVRFASSNVANFNDTLTWTEVPATELVSLFRFDKLGGNTMDTARRYNPADSIGNHGILKNGTNQNTAGRFESGISFDGVDDSVLIPNSNQLNTANVSQRTIATWFRADDASISTRKQTMFEEGGSTRGLNIYLEDGQIYVGGWNRDRNQVYWAGDWISAPVTSNQWHHVALVLDATHSLQPNSLKAYLNGELIGTAQGSTVFVHAGDISLGNGTTRFADGTSSTRTSPYAGKLDDLRIYNRPLSQTEIAALALKPDSVSEPLSFASYSESSGGNLGAYFDPDDIESTLEKSQKVGLRPFHVHQSSQDHELSLDAQNANSHEFDLLFDDDLFGDELDWII